MTRALRHWTVPGALVLVQIFFGLQYLAAKVVLEQIPPGLWALLRIAAASLVLLACVGALGRRLPRSPADVGRLALYSLFGVVLNQYCFHEGLSRTTATHASILMTSVPVSALAFAVLLGVERFSWQRAVSIAVAIVGALLVIGPTESDLSPRMLAGDLLILANATSYAFFLVISRRLLGRVDPLGATTLLMIFGTVGMLVPGIPAASGFDAAAVSGRVWLLGAFIVLLPTAAGYVLTYWALARTDSSVVAFFVYLQPVVAASLAAVLLAERPGARTLSGAALIFAAVYLALGRHSARRASNSAPSGSTASSTSNRGE